LNEPQSKFLNDWLKALQYHLVACILRIPCTLSNIKPVDEYYLADICGIVASIKATIPKQQVKTIDSSGQQPNRPARASWHPGALGMQRFNCWNRRRHSDPTCPPGVSGVQAFHKHWAGPPFDPDSRLAVHSREWKASSQECVCGGALCFHALRLATAYLKSELLIWKIVIFPTHACGRDLRVAASDHTKIADDHQVFIPPRSDSKAARARDSLPMAGALLPKYG